MELSKWILLFTAMSCVAMANITTHQWWDIIYQLDQLYGLRAVNTDVDFPMDITMPTSGLLYSISAHTLFNDGKLPDEPLYLQLNFQPNLTLNEFYFLAIRDPDGTLRFSISMHKGRHSYGVQLRHNLLNSDDGEQRISFLVPQFPGDWRLGVWITENSVEFFTECPRLQPTPFHVESDIRLLGQPLFQKGASAFLLNSGLKSSPMYFQGILTEFTLHSGTEALLAPCKSTELREESGEPGYVIDPNFSNVIKKKTTQIEKEAEIRKTEKKKHIKSVMKQNKKIKNQARYNSKNINENKSGHHPQTTIQSANEMAITVDTESEAIQAATTLATSAQPIVLEDDVQSTTTTQHTSEHHPQTELTSEQSSQETTSEQSFREARRPNCTCLEKILTQNLLERLREEKTNQSKQDVKLYNDMLQSPSFLRIVNELLTEYFDRPEVIQRYNLSCDCPSGKVADVKYECPVQMTTPEPFDDTRTTSQNILGALKRLSNGVIIMNSRSVLAKVAHSLATGTMVYVNSEDMFFLKVDERQNTWRTIDMNTQSESVNIPEPPTTTTTTPKPHLAEHLIGRNLMLIALDKPTTGKLQLRARLPSGYLNTVLACQRAAHHRNLPGLFYPLINTDVYNMDYALTPMYRYNLPIINIHGNQLFDDFAHMIEGRQSTQAPIYTFEGIEIESDPLAPCVWVGAKPIYSGGRYKRNAQSKCHNWQTDELEENGLAVRIQIRTNAIGFFDQSNSYNESCSKSCRILCIQQTPSYGTIR